MSLRPVGEVKGIKEIVENIQQCNSNVHAGLWSNFLCGQNVYLSAFRNGVIKKKKINKGAD